MELKCPRCKKPVWNPIAKCEGCGYSIPFILENPSEYQEKEKWPKHGLVYNGITTIIDPSLWGKAPGSKFVSTVDITRLFTMVAASGSIIIPNDSGRDQSYVFYVGSVVGGGILGGQWQDFYAVRLVDANDSDTIHIFPDTIRSVVDKEVVCGQCYKTYIVSKRPDFCSCGTSLR